MLQLKISNEKDCLTPTAVVHVLFYICI